MNTSVGTIFAIMSMLGYGLGNAISKAPVEALGSRKTLFYRNILISVVLFVILIFNLKESQFNSTYILVGLLISLIGYIPIIAFFEAIKRGKVGVISPVASSSLIVTIFLSIIFFKETLTHNQVFAILFIILGIILISVNLKDLKRSNIFSISSGVPFALIACLGWGLVFFLMKFPVSKLGPIFSAFILESGLVIFSGIHLKSKGESFKVHRKYYKYLFITAIATMFGTLFYNYGINATSVSLVAAISACAPLVVTIYGKVVYKEKLSLQQYSASLVIVIGIITLSYFR